MKNDCVTFNSWESFNESPFNNEMEQSLPSFAIHSLARQKEWGAWNENINQEL